MPVTWAVYGSKRVLVTSTSCGKAAACQSSALPPQMDLLNYASDGAGSPSPHSAGKHPGSDSEDSYFVGSEADSDISATRREREAQQRLKAQEIDVEAGPSTSSVLPDPLSALSGIRHPPTFLTPQATRPLAAPAHAARTAPAAAVGRDGAGAAPGDRPAGPADAGKPEWDISSMAPALKGQTEAEKRGLPASAFISAAPKRYKQEEEGEGRVVTAAQVAMLGGQWKPTADSEPAQSPPQLGPAPPKKAGPTKAMAVDAFLDRGVGGAALPRRRQDRKDKEKNKRALGQSAIGSWKTEAEMVLRQQYDS